MDPRRPPRRDRLRAWLVTGAPTRLAALLLEVAVAVAHAARRRLLRR